MIASYQHGFQNRCRSPAGKVLGLSRMNPASHSTTSGDTQNQKMASLSMMRACKQKNRKKVRRLRTHLAKNSCHYIIMRAWDVILTLRLAPPSFAVVYTSRL